MLIRTKITLKVNKIEPHIPCSYETLNLDNSSKKRIKKILLIPNSTLGELFDDTTHISIGQNCLHKKNPFEYIVPPPTSGVGTIINQKLGSKYILTKIMFN